MRKKDIIIIEGSERGQGKTALINQKPKCKKCRSAFTYIRIKEGSIVCRSCGHIEKIKD